MNSTSNASDLLFEHGLEALVSLFGLIGAVITLLIARHYQRVGEDWPLVEGTIQQVCVTKGEGRDPLTYAALDYSYFCKQYESGVIERVFLKEHSARVFAEKFRNRKLPVHVNPRDPSISVVLKKDIQIVERGLN